MLKNRYDIDEQTFAVGFTTNSPHKILGYHSPHLLAVVTEAHAVPPDYINAVKRLNPSLLLLTGNSFHQQRRLLRLASPASPPVGDGADRRG